MIELTRCKNLFQLFTLLLLSTVCSAQVVELSDKIALLSDGKEAKGFSYKSTKGACFTPLQYFTIEEKIAENKAKIKSQKGNALDQQALLKMADNIFEWPMQAAAGWDQPGYQFVSAYVDHDVNSGSAIDFACSNLTYDAGSYNHQGTDYAAYPFGWHAMDEERIEVIAAEGGVIVHKDDGYFDENCANNNLDANIVILEHSNGTQTWYAHLKDGSVTSKAIGETVATGELLGIVGSSGNSSGPHLHFEVRNAAGDYIDPYYNDSGMSCNTTTTTTWWADQHDHHDPAINAIYIHSSPPTYGPCNDRAMINEIEVAEVCNPIYLGVFIRHQTYNEDYSIKLYRPNGSLFYTYDLTGVVPFQSNAYWYFTINMSCTAPTGTWTYEVTSSLEPTAPVVTTLEMVPVGGIGSAPTVGQWGLLILLLSFLNIGLIAIKNQYDPIPSVSI